MERTAAARVRTREGKRGGFTLVELLMTVAIVGLLAGLAIPNIRTMQFRARAAEVAGDIEAVAIATVSYNGDMHTWPADASVGAVPPELTGFLPDGFSFQGNGYELKFDNRSVPGGLPYDPATTRIIGVTVTSETAELSNAIYELLGGSIIGTLGLSHSFLIDRS